MAPDTLQVLRILLGTHQSSVSSFWGSPKKMCKLQTIHSNSFCIFQIFLNTAVSSETGQPPTDITNQCHLFPDPPSHLILLPERMGLFPTCTSWDRTPTPLKSCENIVFLGSSKLYQVGNNPLEWLRRSLRRWIN